MADGSISIDTKVDRSGLEKGLSAIKSGVAAAGQAAMAGIAAVSAALSAAGVAVVNLGKEYETSMTKASTLFGDVDVNMQNLNANMLSMSSETGMAATQLGDALYSALSAGIPVTEDMGAATDYLSDCAKLAVAGFTDVDTAVGATAKILNAYKMDVGETDRIHKILMATQNKGITTVGELSQSLAQVTPTAAAMNVSFEQVGAALATMTAQGTPTAQATTQLNSLFAELGKAGTVAAENLAKATEGTQYAGMSFQDLMAAGVPMNDVLDLMGGYAEKSGLSLLDMCSSIEAGKAALSLSGQNAEQYTNNLKEMSTSADLVGDAYDKMMDTLEGQTSKLKESGKNLAISIYNGISGKLKDVAKLGNSYVKTLQDAFDKGGVSGLVGSLGNALGDVVSKATEFAPQMIDLAVELLDSLMQGIVDNADGIAEGLAAALEAGINGLVKIIPNMLSAGIKIAKSLVSAIAESLPTLIPQIIEALVGGLVEIVSNIPDLLLLGLKIVNAIAEGIINSIPIVFAGVGEAFKNLFTNADEIAEAYEQQFAGTSEAYMTFKQAIADADAKFESAVTDAESKKQLATDMLALYNELAEKDVQTDEDIALMAQYAAKIAEIYPTLGQYIDPATGLFTANTQAIRDNIDAQAQLALVNAYSEYRDSLYKAMADADMSLREHAGELKETQDAVDALIGRKDDLEDFMKYVFNLGIDNDYAGFKQNLTEIYDKITEVTGLENPWGNYFTQLADGTLQLMEGKQWADAYMEANGLLAMAISNTSEKLAEQNGVLAQHEEENQQYITQKEEARQKALDLNGVISEETAKYNELATAAGIATDATSGAGDAAANAGGQAAETGQMFELAGEGITNGAADAQAGAEGYQAAADMLEGASETAAGAKTGLNEASEELSTTKETILATAADIKGAQDAAMAAQATIAEVVKKISEDAAASLARMTETAASITLTAQGMMEAIETAVNDSLDAIAKAGSDVASALLKAMSDVLTVAAGDSVAATFLNALKSGIESRKSNVSSNASSLASAALNSISGVLSWGAGNGIGSSVASGIAAGIRNGQSSVISAAIAIARSAVNAAKNALGIRSPSAVFREVIGQNVSKGMSVGILDSEGDVLKSIGKLSDDMQDAALSAKMKSAVIDQGYIVGGQAAAVQMEAIAASAGANQGGGAVSIDYRAFARAIWEEAPEMPLELDGEVVADLIEPRVSKIQSRKLSSKRRG